MPNKRFTPPIQFAKLPARPQLWMKRAEQIAQRQLKNLSKLGPALVTNPAYIAWLQKSSMLSVANAQARQLSGSSELWRHPYAKRRPRQSVRLAPVWYTAYPASIVTGKDESTLHYLGRDELWKAFEKIGITAIHTGPMKIAGGLRGWKQTPSIDGHFDRISNEIDPLFGSDDEFIALVESARRHKAIVIDDIVPGHTGKGADFRLAEMNYREYPGIYHMVSIDKKDWDILPDVPKGRDAVNLNEECEAELKKRGYIVGKLTHVIFHDPGVKDTNWSVTAPVTGTDGIKRRWVYLHLFKMGQPTVNWMDPSFAGMKLVIGDVVHSLHTFGARGLRLDANAWLGIEPGESGQPAWTQGHPLSGAANFIIGGMVRKLGGFTFQELNLPIDNIAGGDTGPDLSYDFINRTGQYLAIATGNTDLLQITTREALRLGIQPVSIVHALQNHDEINVELLHFCTLHAADTFHYHGQDMTGMELYNLVKKEIAEAFVDKTDYNVPFTNCGIAATTATVIAGGLGVTTWDDIDEEKSDRIMQAHLLLAAFNALQPGVFALSGWDLVGAWTVSPGELGALLDDGDTRWRNRGGYDLLGHNGSTTRTSAGLPVAHSLYGDIVTQLHDKTSFASQLKRLIALRDNLGLATAKQLDIPAVSSPSVLAMLHELEDSRREMTVLNFSAEAVSCTIRSDMLDGFHEVHDVADEAWQAAVRSNETTIELKPYQARVLLLA